MKNKLASIAIFWFMLFIAQPGVVGEIHFDLETLGYSEDHVFSHHWDSDFVVERSSRVEADFVFTDEDFQRMARVILEVQRSISDEFSVGDGLTFALYIMKVFAEIGDYDLTQEELKALFSTFTKLTQQEIPPVAHDIVDQLDRIQFVRRNANSTVIFHTRNQATIQLDMSQYDESSDASTDSDFDKITIQNRSELNFQSIMTAVQKNELIHFIQTPYKLPILPKRWFSRFNQIYPGVENRIRTYTQISRTVDPMKVSIRGLSVNVDAGILLGKRNFTFNEAYLTPGLLDHSDNPLPSFHIWASSGMVKVKTSIGE
jgi:hypothetical protein